MLWIIIAACVVLGAALLFVNIRLLNGGLWVNFGPLRRAEKCPWCGFPAREFRKSDLIKFGRHLCPNCGRNMSER